MCVEMRMVLDNYLSTGFRSDVYVFSMIVTDRTVATLSYNLKLVHHKLERLRRSGSTYSAFFSVEYGIITETAVYLWAYNRPFSTC